MAEIVTLRVTQILPDTVLQTEINKESLKGFDLSLFYQFSSLKAEDIFYYTVSLLLIILRVWKQNKQTI